MGGLFDDPPKPPKPPPPAPMPDDQSPMVKEAERRKRGEWASRGGRASTILSQDEGSNQPYTRGTLG
jgi:hypothetical protein